MTRAFLIPAVLILLLGGPPPARAANFAAAFLESGLGARGPGMGGAFAAAVDDASAPYWNPAGLVRTRGRQGLASLAPLSLDRLQNSVSFTLNVRGELAFGFSWLHAGVDDIEGRTVGGHYTGKIEDNENAFYVAVGRALGSRLAIGFTMKVLDQRLDVPSWKEASARGHGFDLGLQFRLSRQVYLAAAVRNLKAALDWKVRRDSQQASSTEDDLPQVLVAGLAYRPFEPLLLAIDLYKTDDAFANLGAEWAVNPLLTLRGGLNRVPGDDGAIGSLAAGFSLRPMRSEFLQLSYSYISDQIGAGARNQFGLALRF